jgi:hypothetical protein
VTGLVNLGFFSNLLKNREFRPSGHDLIFPLIDYGVKLL